MQFKIPSLFPSTLLLTVMIALFTGCTMVPMNPIKLEKASMEGAEKLAVYISNIPETDTSFPGADCVLCSGTAELANSALTKHIKSLDKTDIESTVLEIKEAFAGLKLKVTMIEPDGNEIDKLPSFKRTKEMKQTHASKDFKTYGEKHNADLVAVVNINFQGVKRPYSAYVPTGNPVGSIRGLIYVVDVSSNEYIQYTPVDISIPVQGQWKEPPNYPGVTTAYYEAIEALRDLVNKSVNFVDK